MIERYQFDKPLIEGVIVERIRSYILVVEHNGITERCHCPCISNFEIDVAGRPCLLWESPNPNRKTKYTVKAISLNKPEDNPKQWFGIDQSESNRYIEHFLKQNAMPEMVDASNRQVLREQTIGNSRLDFKVGDIYVENKTCVGFGNNIPDYITVKPRKPMPPSDHFYKHVHELSEALKSHEGAILLGTFLYDNGTNMDHDETPDKGGKIMEAMGNGVQGWQVNLKLDETGVDLVSYHRIKMEF